MVPKRFIASWLTPDPLGFVPLCAMAPQTYNLFVYGSLRKGFPSSAYRYISEHFDFVAMAKVRGLLYDMGDYPAALPADGEHFIIGELYTLRHPEEFGWAIAQLDDYEGVDPEADEVPLYRREVTTVFAGEEIHPAWIYWYNGSVEGKPPILSGDVLRYLEEKMKA